MKNPPNDSPAKSFNPPIVTSETLSQHEVWVTQKFKESAINPLFLEEITFTSDLDIEGGEIVGEPINEFLNRKISESQNGFKSRQTEHAALLYNEDGTPFQAIMSVQLWDSQKSRYGKNYRCPTVEPGKFSPAYLPRIPPQICTDIGLDADRPFWEQIEADPSIPIVITEGAKKSLCALSHGSVAIAIYGIDSGSKKIDEQHTLIPDLARLCQLGRTFIIAFDQDEKPETVESVARAIGRLIWLLRKECKNITVKVATWEPSQGKGIDDLVINCGADALHKAISEASIPLRETSWLCMESHNHQLGYWNDLEIENETQHTEMLTQSGWDTNLRFIESLPGSKEGSLIHKWKKFRPSTDFDFKVSKLLSDKTGGGLELLVTWLAGSKVCSQSAYIKNSETLTNEKFRLALQRETGQRFSAKFTQKNHDLENLLKNRTAVYRRNGGKTYRLTDRVGQQDDSVWVFADCQFKADGSVSTERATEWVFNHELCKLENVPSPKIATQNPEALKTLVQALTNFYHADALPSVWLTLGFAVMGLHRQPVMMAAGSMASLAVYGEKGGGKSTAQLAAASLYGLQDFKLSDVSISAFFELAKNLGSLPIQWDDPIRQGKYAQSDEEKVNSALWKLFSALGRNVRGNTQSPETVVCVSTNRTLGNDNAAIASRLISFIFPVCPVNRRAGEALTHAMRGASGGLSQLLAIPYEHQAIVEQGNQLLEHLSESDARNAQSLSTLAYFTQKFCDLVDVHFDALSYIKTEICPQANEQGAGKDSLTDFLERLSTLKSENLVGDWNAVETQTRDGKRFLAIHLPSVWETFSTRFKPNYGSSLIAALCEGVGGVKNVNAKFVESRDNCISYERALNIWIMGTGGTEAPQLLTRGKTNKSLLIPRAIAEKAGFFTSNDAENPKLPNDEPEVTLKLPDKVTCETQSQQDIQPQVTQVTEVTPKNEGSGKTAPSGLPIGHWESGPTTPEMIAKVLADRLAENVLRLSPDNDLIGIIEKQDSLVRDGQLMQAIQLMIPHSCPSPEAFKARFPDVTNVQDYFQKKTDWKPTHVTSKGMELIITKLYGDFAACQNSEGKNFPALKQSDLTPIGGAVCAA
jgi:hypothetical protein